MSDSLNLNTIIPMLFMGNSSSSDSAIMKVAISLLVIFLVHIISICKPYVTEKIINIIDRLNPTKKVYTIKGSISYEKGLYYSSIIPLEFRAVMDYLYNKITSDVSTNVKYKINTEGTWVRNAPDLKFIEFCNENIGYDVTDNINITINKWTEVNGNGNITSSHKFYFINLKAKDNDINKIIEFIRNLTESYELEKARSIKNLNIYILDKFDKDFAYFNIIEFNSTKNFDNMFFEEKDMLLDRLDRFKDKKYYQRLGIPHTLGMMLHGEPGTGKTSAIKAIAKYTGRHIFLIPVNKIDSADKLRQIFITEKINFTYRIPQEKRLYVFEEIDCSLWKNIVRSRAFKTDCSESNTNSKVNINIMENFADRLTECLIKKDDKDGEDIKLFSRDKKDDITLGDILEILDGMIEISDRMIIMTSNHPERLDPALLRPGRIDIQIKFKKMRRIDICNMYKLWFNKDFPEKHKNRLKDYKFSQAEIGNIFSTRNNKYILDTLCS